MSVNFTPTVTIFKTPKIKHVISFMKQVRLISTLFNTSIYSGTCKIIRISHSRSRWPRGLSSRSAAAWLLGSRVRIPLGAWMFVSCLYVVLSCVGRGLCDGLITRPEESYRVSNCVWLRNLRWGGQGPMWAVEPLDGWMEDKSLPCKSVVQNNYGNFDS
jgi:hypothetical protein